MGTKREIIVNSNILETRVVILENSTLTDCFFERKKERGIVGNIYKGVVRRVLPGMQAAFVDIGLERAAFLHAGDVTFLMEDSDLEMEDEEEIDFEKRPRRGRGRTPSIQELLEEGQEIVVQVAKGPIGTKGARVGSHISLPGRFVVHMPTVSHIGVSRRISNVTERRRLKKMVEKAAAGSGGFIVRTVSENISEKQLKADINYLKSLWAQVQRTAKSSKAPSLLHSDLDMNMRVLRDYLNEDYSAVYIDSMSDFRAAQHFIKQFNPRLQKKIRHFKNRIPIFDHFGVEVEISRALGKRIWLKSGGYIIIEQTEALTAIDVNTGKFVGSHNLEDTILKTNLEAIQEIVHQLRIRNIGGIIILDLIDMEREINREKVFIALQDALRDDRARCTINKISSLGLIEMTRKRVRESLQRYLTESCYYCEGRGYLKSKKAICYEIYREIEREAALTRGKVIYASVHPQIGEILCDAERRHIEELEKHLKKRVVIRANEEFHLEQFDVIAASRSRNPSS